MPRFGMQRNAGAQEVGAAAVEFALLVTVLLAIVFGVISFGTVVAQKATVANAVRSGARFGSVNLYAGLAGSPHTCDKVVERTREQATTIGLEPEDLAVSVRYLSASGVTLDRCSVSAGSTSVSGAEASEPPCDDPTAANPGKLYVDADVTGRISIPVLGIGADVELGSTGAYACEYK